MKLNIQVIFAFSFYLTKICCAQHQYITIFIYKAQKGLELSAFCSKTGYVRVKDLDFL